jgi:hypothetical protein
MYPRHKLAVITIIGVFPGIAIDAKTNPKYALKKYLLLNIVIAEIKGIDRTK